MNSFYAIIKADYLQRTRSYSFLITLAVTVFAAYSFIPANDANYTTLSATGFKGEYNSAWVGYVSAIMTTVMLSIYGFLLVNSGIKKDMDTGVGSIIATTPVSNFKYLLSKQLSNYLVLLTIAGLTFIVSIAVFFYRGTNFPFIFSNFLFPYLLFAVPTFFIVSALAVVAEVYLVKKSLFQFIIYLAICGFGISTLSNLNGKPSKAFLDPTGLSLMTTSVTQQINREFNQDIKSVSFGFIFTEKRAYKTFTWEGLEWSPLFILTRLVWMFFAIVLIYISSLSFHRFDYKLTTTLKKKKIISNDIGSSKSLAISKAFKVIALPPVEFKYGIYPLIKTEFLLLLRKGNQWFWLVSAGLWIAICFVPLDISYSILLPLLLFLQVTRWSELATKEKTNLVHYFAFASYKPLQRMLPAQILAGFGLGMLLSLPIIFRTLLAGDSLATLNILNGTFLIVLLAVALGIVSGGKKLFEIFFFLLTYCVLNKVPFTNYLGSPNNNNVNSIAIVSFISLALLVVAFTVRKYQIRKS